MEYGIRANLELRWNTGIRIHTVGSQARELGLPNEIEEGVSVITLWKHARVRPLLWLCSRERAVVQLLEDFLDHIFMARLS